MGEDADAMAKAGCITYTCLFQRYKTKATLQKLSRKTKTPRMLVAEIPEK